MLPTSVWIAPITLVFFAQEGFADNYAFMGTLLGVYMIAVILRATMKKMGLLKDMKEAGEKSVKDKKDKRARRTSDACVDRSGISGSERGRINDQLWISAHSMPREGRVLCRDAVERRLCKACGRGVRDRIEIER